MEALVTTSAIPSLEFSVDDMRRMADAVVARSTEHVASLGAQPVLGDVNAHEFCRSLREPVPETGCALGLFNGVCMFLLGLLTELGVTTETTAKWAELDALTTRFLGVGVTAETADTFGLQVLGVGVAVFVAGWVLARVSGEGRQPGEK